MKSELISIFKRFTKPLTGFAIAGVSTTLVACYGAYEPGVRTHDPDYCEAMLLRSCSDDTLTVPEECVKPAAEVNQICSDASRSEKEQ